MATRALVPFIEAWYNRERLHSTLGYVSPNAFEQNLTRRRRAAKPRVHETGSSSARNIVQGYAEGPPDFPTLLEQVNVTQRGIAGVVVAFNNSQRVDCEAAVYYNPTMRFPENFELSAQDLFWAYGTPPSGTPGGGGGVPPRVCEHGIDETGRCVDLHPTLSPLRITPSARRGQP